MEKNENNFKIIHSALIYIFYLFFISKEVKKSVYIRNLYLKKQILNSI